MKKGAYFFSHDSNASNDEKILNMRADLGWEGYGIYWAIIEKLRDANGYKFKIDSIKGLAVALGAKKTTVDEIIKNYDLFSFDDEFFWSDSLNRRMKEMEEKSSQAKHAANKRWNQNSNTDLIQEQCNSNADEMQQHDFSNADSMPMQCNEMKRKEMKRNEIILTTTTTTSAREKIFELFEKKIPPGFDPKYEAEKFISMNEAFDWKTRGGRPILENIEKFVNAWIARLMEHKKQNTVKINGNGSGNYQKNQREWGAIFAGACDIVDQFFDKAEHLAGSTN